MPSSSHLALGLALGLLVQLHEAPASALGSGTNRFQTYVPPNNDNVGRYVMLVITAVSAMPTTVNVIDDGADGDTDDSATGIVLVRGQSYLVRLADGGVNDDAGGKWDGDYFRIEADHPVVVQQATHSNWQHDWAPSDGIDSIGTTFYLYSPPSSGADADLNVFAYQNGTSVSIEDITVVPKSNSGFTSVDETRARLLLRTTLDAGEDLVVARDGLGLDIFDPGRTYVVRASAPVTVQAGHLGQVNGGNSARDGGGYVPSVEGSAIGSLYYFTIPHNPGAESEKELRIVCFDDATSVTLSGYEPGAGYVTIDARVMNAYDHADFVGASHTSFRTHELYRLEVTPGHRCVVFESNWIETGAVGTSDYLSAVSSSDGTDVGRDFVAYVGPPGYQTRVSGVGSAVSHLYVFAPPAAAAAVVRVRDLDTNGSILDRTLTVPAGGFVDVRIDTTTYAALNRPTLGIRPYVSVSADRAVSVTSGNPNDNWLTFLQSPRPRVLRPIVAAASTSLTCGGATSLNVGCANPGTAAVSGASLLVTLPSWLTVDAATLDAATVTTLADGSRTLRFELEPVAPGAERQRASIVSLPCDGASACIPSALLPITVECAASEADGSLVAQETLAVAVRSSTDGLVTDVRAEVLAAGPVRVAFDVGTDDGRTTYLVLRSTNPSDAGAAVIGFPAGGAGLAPRTLSFDDHSVVPGTSYFYRVRALRSACSTDVGPVSVRTASIPSGALTGGLESNGRLAALITRRELAERSAGTGTGAAIGALLPTFGDDSLAAWLPDVGPAGSAPVASTPGDLAGFTNAQAVFGADYVDARGRVVASVLVMDTVGESYEHVKAICDRAHGATLAAVESHAEPDGTLVVGRSHDVRTGVGAEFVELKLYFEEGGDVRVESGLLRGDFPTPRPGQRVHNLQVWSGHAGHATTLVRALLDGAGLRADATPWVAPSAHVAHATTLGGRVHLVIEDHGLGVEGLRIEGLVDRGHGERERVAFPLSGPDHREDLGPFHEGSFDLLDASGRTLDDVWISDGAYTAFDDGLFGGATEVLAFDAAACDAFERDAPEDPLRLAGCARVRLEVDAFGGVARQLGGGGGPIDLRTHRSVSFVYRATSKVLFCLEDGGPRPVRRCAELEPSFVPKRVTLALDALRDDACEHGPATEARFLSLAGYGNGPLEVELGGMSFGARDPDVHPTDPCARVARSSALLGCSLDPARSRPRSTPIVVALAFVALASAMRRRRTR